MIISAVSSGLNSAVTPETQAAKPATNDGDVDARASAAAPRANDGDADDRTAYSSAVSRSSSVVLSALTELAASDK
jgi:hypothetical protein